MTGKVRLSSHARTRTRPVSAAPPASRIYLRELEDDDAPACVAAARASRHLHRPWVQPALTPEAFATRMQKRLAATNSVSLLALRAEDDAVVGLFNLSEIIRGPLQ